MIPMPKDSPSAWVNHTVTADEAGGTVQDILTGPMGVSRRMIQRLTRAKGLQHNRRAAWLNAKVRAGDVVSARIHPAESAGLAPVPMDLRVVYEDGEVLAIDKPPFLLVHPTSPEQDRTLAHGVAHHLRSRGRTPACIRCTASTVTRRGWCCSRRRDTRTTGWTCSCAAGS